MAPATTCEPASTRRRACAIPRLAWTIFRPSVIFGRGDGLFFRFASLLRFAPVLPLARAEARFAPVYVGDVAEAFARALAHPHSIGHTYELFGPRVISLREIVRWTAELTGQRRWIIGLPDCARLPAGPDRRMAARQADLARQLPLAVDRFGRRKGRTRRTRHRLHADGTDRARDARRRPPPEPSSTHSAKNTARPEPASLPAARLWHNRPMKIYRVGGAVRDKLLGKPSSRCRLRGRRRDAAGDAG